jgi:hypothetical protein
MWSEPQLQIASAYHTSKLSDAFSVPALGTRDRAKHCESRQICCTQNAFFPAAESVGNFLGNSQDRTSRITYISKGYVAGSSPLLAPLILPMRSLPIPRHPTQLDFSF